MTRPHRRRAVERVTKILGVKGLCAAHRGSACARAGWLAPDEWCEGRVALVGDLQLL
jgi:hypothetical protein